MYITIHLYIRLTFISTDKKGMLNKLGHRLIRTALLLVYCQLCAVSKLISGWHHLLATGSSIGVLFIVQSNFRITKQDQTHEEVFTGQPLDLQSFIQSAN